MHDPLSPLEQPVAAASPQEGLPDLGPSRLRRRRRKGGLWIRRSLALIVFASVVGGLGYGAVNGLKTLMPARTVAAGDPAGRKNVLVIGIDPKVLPVEVTDKTSRRLADTLMLFSYDPVSQRGFVLSIPRETKASLGDAGEGVLGDALAIGGIPLVRDTVEEITGLPIQHFIALDLDAAKQLTSQLGGTDIYVAKAIQFHDKDTGIKLDLTPGWHALDAPQTLAYAYQRTVDELDRLERQQMLVRVWQQRLHESWNWLWLMGLTNKALGALETDVPKQDFEAMLTAWRKLDPLDLTFGLLPGDANRRGEWLLSPKRWETLLPRLQNTPGVRSVSELKPTVEVLYDDPADERVMTLATTLQGQGFQVVRTAHYPVDQDENVIADRTRADERSQTVIAALEKALGGARVEVAPEGGTAYAAQLTVRLGKPFFK